MLDRELWPPEGLNGAGEDDVVIRRAEIRDLIVEMDDALSSGSNDAEHNTLFDVRQAVAQWIGLPVRHFDEDEESEHG